MLHTPRQRAETLLSALDPLPYPLRMRELVSRVRDMEDVGPLLRELDARGPYERGLAVVVAAVTRDTEWVADRIADPDSFVRGHALRVADHLGVPDSVYESALADAPATVRRRLLRAIASGRRTALADRLVDGLRDRWGDAEAARLLPGCSPGTAARLLPELFHAVREWKRIGGRYPAVVLDTAERELAALPVPLREDWWRRYSRAVAGAVGGEPLRALDLVEERGPARLPYALNDCLRAFAAVAPGRVLRLLLDGRIPSYRGAFGRSLLTTLARSGADELPEYGRMLAEKGELAAFLKELPPSRRLAFHAQATAGRGPGAGAVDEALLEALPRSGVAEEARRVAAAARERGPDRADALIAESFLPVAEAREGLVAATRRPAAEDRAMAWPLLIRNAARSGSAEAVTSVLAEAARLRNEQDPVRRPALHALSRTAPALFTEEAEPHLDRIVADAVDARDSSPATRRCLSDLAVSVLREHAAGGSRELVSWSLRTLVRISGHTGGADLGRLDARLRRGQEHQVFEALRPWIEAGTEKADYGLVFALARAVGRRAEGMPELQELLWQAIRFGNDTTVRHAVELWLEPLATRDERVARVLALHPSAGALRPVLSAVARRRTDLLDVLLTDTPPYGRFLTRGSPWTMPVDGYVRRWLPRQREAAARRLAGTAADTGLPSYARARAVEAVACVPGAGAGLVRRWTDADDIVLAEAALGALVRTDRPGDALPELLAHTGTDRARVAVHAAGRASRHVAPSVLADLLRGVLLGPGAKVASRKEAARLAAALLPVPVAARVLAEAYGQPGAHTDVRAACVAFAGPLFGEEPVRSLLNDAAGAEPVLRAAVLRVTPLDLPERHRDGYARLVREVCRTGDPETAARAFGALGGWAPWSPDAPAVLAAATADLSNRTGWRAAAEGLVAAAAGSAAGAGGLREALRVLAEAETAGTADVPPSPLAPGDAEPRRDRPARQRVDHLVARLAQQARTAAGPVREAALGAGDLLAGYDAFAPQAALVTALHADLDAAPEGVDAALDLLAARTAGRPALAASVAGRLGDRLGRGTYEGDAGVFLDAARRLTDHGGHAEGLLAVALTAAFGARTGWAAPWRSRLRALRRHPVADVRDAALARTTAPE
ncbi:hypothetical protein [Streptomyces fructofermentans]|uniref:HEAT repeat domain-containing protein n=1 Tax=Streptomyces fructofermentans TaxID=152141 RepID=A0A918K2T9_9ACTN|nr:hypothetical protein [Streptomyces fructofermentans]GGX44211.1 hypothetical protein GCM10010515_08870 [Streptomyces fructofermentans]